MYMALVYHSLNTSRQRPPCAAWPGSCPQCGSDLSMRRRLVTGCHAAGLGCCVFICVCVCVFYACHSTRLYMCICACIPVHAKDLYMCASLARTWSKRTNTCTLMRLIAAAKKRLAINTASASSMPRAYALSRHTHAHTATHTHPDVADSTQQKDHFSPFHCRSKRLALSSCVLSTHTHTHKHTHTRTLMRLIARSRMVCF